MKLENEHFSRQSEEEKCHLTTSAHANMPIFNMNVNCIEINEQRERIEKTKQSLLTNFL